CGVCPPSTSRTIRSRPCGVRRAFLCTFIRSSGKSLKLRQLQLPRSGPDGQPMESPHLGAINTLRFVEEKIGVGLWSLDIETDRMEWSSGFYALLGLDPGSAEPSLSLFRSMMHPEDRLSRQDIDRIMQEGIPIERDLRIIRRDGSIRCV